MEAARFDRELAHRFYAAAIQEGVFFHAGWHHGIAAMHTAADIDEALEKIEAAVRRL